MTSLLSLCGDIQQKLTFKENSLNFLLNSGSNIFFSQQDADHMAGDRARRFMSRMEMRASSLINSFIFVGCAGYLALVFVNRK